jgi:hypothetical protein
MQSRESQHQVSISIGGKVLNPHIVAAGHLSSMINGLTD